MSSDNGQTASKGKGILGRLRPLIYLLLLVGTCSVVPCDKGDYLGGVERAARAAFDGWDMWQTEGVRPYETPMPLPPEGAVPVDGVHDYARAVAEMSRVAEVAPRAALAYRRYCHHCHGENGDGRIIVGESFNPPLPDLRSPLVQSQSDEEIYGKVAGGTARMIPLGDSIDHVELLLAIHHLRSLAGAPTRPYFDRKYVDPR